jgi:hypothetical protein
MMMRKTTMPDGPPQEFAIYVVHALELGADVRAISRRPGNHSTGRSKYVRRFATWGEAELYRRLSVSPRFRRRYIVDTIPPLAECGKTLPRPTAMEQRELPI